jgi:histidinol-phosphate aminotransferase
MPVQPLPAILGIEPYKGGESSLAGFEKPIKLASNENPLGQSPRVRDALLEAVRTLERYPDGHAVALRAAIGERYGIDPARLVCGAGSDEIFQLLARGYLAPGDEIVQSQYAFLVYRLVAQQSGAVVRTAADTAFTADVDAMLALVGPKTRIVFLANPNNPTGTYLPYAEIKRLHAALPETVLLVLDGAYAEYVDRNDYASGIELAGAFDNVLMTRTFSKIHGLAALRLGWAFGPQSVIDTLNRVRGPFNINSLALSAGIAAIQDLAFTDESARFNTAERDRVCDALAEMGLRFTPSVANFVLAHFPQSAGRTALDMDRHLRSRGLIVRLVGSYGLPDALRLSIGTRADNDALIAAMHAFPGLSA